MTPEQWDAYAQKFGQALALEKLGPRPDRPGVVGGMVRAAGQGATFGTLDELFEILTLIQTKKSERIAVVLVGHEYWDPLVNWLRSTVLGTFDAISPDDVKIFTIVDTAGEAFDLIKSSQERSFF